MTSEFIDNRRGGANTASMTTENRTIIEGALADLVSTGGTGALESLLSDDFVHHKPDSTASTKAEWLAAVRAVPLADLRVEVLRVLADGDHVMMYSRRWLDGGGPEIAGVDIWRLDGGRIVEGWEILERPAQVPGNLLWWQPAGR